MIYGTMPETSQDLESFEERTMSLKRSEEELDLRSSRRSSVG